MIAVAVEKEDGTTVIVKQPITPEFLEQKFYMMEVSLDKLKKQCADESKFKQIAIMENDKLSADKKKNLTVITDKVIEKMKVEVMQKIEHMETMRTEFLDFLSNEIPETHEHIMQDYQTKFEHYQQLFEKSN